MATSGLSNFQNIKNDVLAGLQQLPTMDQNGKQAGILYLAPKFAQLGMNQENAGATVQILNEWSTDPDADPVTIQEVINDVETLEYSPNSSSVLQAQNPFSFGSPTAAAGGGGAFLPTTTTTTSGGFAPNPAASAALQNAQQQQRRSVIPDLRLMKFKGGKASVNKLNSALATIKNPKDEKDSKAIMNFSNAVNSLVDEAGNIVFASMGTFDSVTGMVTYRDPRSWDVIRNLTSSSLQFDSVTAESGKIVSTPNKLFGGDVLQDFQFTFDSDTKEKDKKKPVRRIQLLLAKRPAIDSSDDISRERSIENRRMYDETASALYSKRNVQAQVRVLKELMKANNQTSRAFQAKTGHTPGVSLGVEAPAAKMAVDGYLAITLSDLEAMQYNANVLATNMTFINTLGRKQPFDPRSFKGSSALVRLDQPFIDWINTETFGPPAANGSYCFPKAERIGDERKTKKYKFVCGNPANFFEGVMQRAAVKFVDLGGITTNEYNKVLLNMEKVTGVQGPLFLSGFAKKKTISGLFFLARAFGKVRGFQNIDPNGNSNFIINFGTGIRKAVNDDVKKMPEHRPTDAMLQLFGRKATNVYVLDNDKDALVANIGNTTIFQTVENVVNNKAGVKSKITSEVLPLTSLNRIVNVATFMQSSDAFKQLAGVADSETPDSTLLTLGNVATGITFGHFRLALHAEAVAIFEIKKSVEDLLSDANSTNTTKKNASLKSTTTLLTSSDIAV